MTANPSSKKKFEDIIKHSEVLNQVVVDSTTMEELGRIEVLWMYPQINRVLGFVCKSGFLGSKKAAFKLPQLESTGHSGILVSGDGEPTVAAKVKQLESLIHSEVWSDSGEKVGQIIDCLFNYRSGVIVRYLLVPGRLAGITDGVYFLSPKAIKSFGQNRVLIDADAAANLKPYRKGWKYKLAEVRDTFKEEYVDEVTGELRSFAQKMQLFSKEAMHKVEHWGDRLRDETQIWIEQAKERGQAFYAKAKTSGQTIFDQIRTEGLSFNDHMQDTASRPDSEIPQDVTFPQDDVSGSTSAMEDYDRESWDDEWNDWEDEQDGSVEQQTTPQTDEWETQSAEEWDDWTDESESFEESNREQRETTASQRNKTNMSAPDASHSTVSQEESPNLHRPLDIWDDDWVDEDNTVYPTQSTSLSVESIDADLANADSTHPTSIETISVEAVSVDEPPTTASPEETIEDPQNLDSPDHHGEASQAKSASPMAPPTRPDEDDDDPWI